MRYQWTYIFILWVWVPNSAWSQALYNPRWGNPTKEEWSLERCKFDPEATAVVLSEVGAWYPENLEAGRVAYDRYIRIKILRPEGLAAGSIQLSCRADDEKITRLKAQTLNREGNKVIRTPLALKFLPDSVDPSGHRHLRFTARDLKVGSIFEYKYRLVTTDLETLKPWHFQGHLPVLYSDIRLVGFDEQDYLVASIGVFTPRVRNQPLRWIRKNLPSLVPIPYGPGTGTERIALHFQFSHQPTLLDLSLDFSSRQLVKSKAGQDSVRWRILNENLEYGSQFHESPERYAALQSIVRSLIRHDTSELGRAQVLYRHLRDHLQWNGRYRSWVAQSPGDIYFRRQGSSAELNLLLLEMLRIADLPAQKCFIATRDHGPDRWQMPFLSAFNHVVVRLPFQEEIIAMDLTETTPWGLLPLNSLVKQGYIAWGADSGWVEISPQGINRSYLSIKMSKLEDGLILDYQGSADGYERLRWAKLLVRDSSLAMAPSPDPEMPFVWQALQQLPAQSAEEDRLAYLDSMGLSPPCLTETKRDLPLDFLYPKEVSLELRLPSELGQPNSYAIQAISHTTADSSFHFYSRWKQNSEEWIGTIKWGYTKTHSSSLHYSEVLTWSLASCLAWRQSTSPWIKDE